MYTDVTPSAEISVAVLSWINDQLRTTVRERETRRIDYSAEWIQNTVTALTVGLSGLCILVLQRWA